MADQNEQYLKLITSEYSKKDLFNQYVLTFLQSLDATHDNLEEMSTLFNIDEAVGDQLDKLGELVGISRVLPIVNADIPSSLDDDIYRRVIKSKIMKNHWDGSYQGLCDIIENVISGIAYRITDNQDMSYYVDIILPSISDEMFSLISEGFILPKSSGISVNYTIIERQLFGWDSNTVDIGGWDSGLWRSF